MARETLTITLEAEARETLDRLAGAMGTDREALAREALTRWLAVQAHQVANIERGAAEADAGIFVPDDEMERYWREHGE
jgi:predicted transcriptional regulator